MILGLEGNMPSQIDPNYMPIRLAEITQNQQLRISADTCIHFDEHTDLHYIYQALPEHPNAMRLTARDTQGIILYTQEYYSIGGGFILDKDEFAQLENAQPAELISPVPYPFDTMDQLLIICKDNQLSIYQVMLANETHHRSH